MPRTALLRICSATEDMPTVAGPQCRRHFHARVDRHFQCRFLSFPRFAAPLAAIHDMLPVPLPFLAPSERLAAGRADFGRQMARIAERFRLGHLISRHLIFRFADGRQRRGGFRRMGRGHPELRVFIKRLLAGQIGKMVMSPGIEALVLRAFPVNRLMRDRVHPYVMLRVVVIHCFFFLPLPSTKASRRPEC
jgi:hypothetical protein